MTTATLTTRERIPCTRQRRFLCPFQRFIRLRSMGRLRVAGVLSETIARSETAPEEFKPQI